MAGLWNRLWQDRHSRTAMIILICSLILFVILALVIRGGQAPAFDRDIVMSFRDPQDPADPIGSIWVQEAARDLTALGGTPVLLLVTLAVVGFLWIKRNPRAMTVVLVATIGGMLVNTFLKELFSRPRPDFVPHLQHAYLASFPSGHSLMSAVVYLTLASLLMRLVESPWLQTYLLVVAGLVTVLVGISRIYLGVHYPTDVLAGWCAGMVWASLCWLVMQYLQEHGEVEQTVEEDKESERK